MSGKGLLKRAIGGIKSFVIILPFAVTVAGVATGIGGAIAASVNKGKLTNFETAEAVQQVIDDKQAELQDKVDKGEMSVEDYAVEHEKAESYGYRKEVASAVYADNKEYHDLVKSLKVATLCGYSGFGTGIVGMLGSAVFYTRESLEALAESADFDFEEARMLDCEARERRLAKKREKEEPELED